ncbi:MAG: DUF2480 family protein [Cytophagales bacterium]|nr:DUF2480 family protein [Cytophagales bacterium]
MDEHEIINRVAKSPLVTLDLEALFPAAAIVEFDIKDLLYQELVLREKELREFVKTHPWSNYQGKYVALFCSADAIVPTWAYMLIAIALQPYAQRTVFGTRGMLIEAHFHEALQRLDWESYRDAKVVIKGCGDVHVPESVFVEAATRLRAVAASILYGEPCSTVPLFKRQKQNG